MNEGPFDEAPVKLVTFFHLEMHLSRNHGEEGIVAGTGDSIAWVEFRATLAKDDIAGFCPLIAENLDAETLGNRIAAKVS
jgi:hypothetical protein